MSDTPNIEVSPMSLEVGGIRVHLAAFTCGKCQGIYFIGCKTQLECPLPVACPLCGIPVTHITVLRDGETLGVIDTREES